jgi:hypothetical protein
MKTFIVTVRCTNPKCHYEIEGVVISAPTAYQAKQYSMKCPAHDFDMEVIGDPKEKRT